jgi:hypothetical protein
MIALNSDKTVVENVSFEKFNFHDYRKLRI